METTTPLIADGSSGSSASVAGPFFARALHDWRWSESNHRTARLADAATDSRTA